MSFKKLFDESTNAPLDGNYKGRHIFCSDKFPVKNKDVLRFCIEKTNSHSPQGFSVRVIGKLKVSSETHNLGKYGRMLFWEDTEILDPSNIEIQVFTKESSIYISNIWEQISPEGKKTAAYVSSSEWLQDRGNGAAMYSEEIKGGRRYFCNDGEEDDDFDDIIFTVKNLGPSENPFKSKKSRSKK